MTVNDLLVLPRDGNSVRINRSGVATLCRYVHEVLRANRSCVVVAPDADFAAKIRALLPLFTDFGQDAFDPLSVRPVLDCALRDAESRLGVANTLACFYGLTFARPHCLLLSLEHLLYRHIPVSFFHSRTVTLAAGQEYVPELIVEQAVDWGYQRVPMVCEVGDIAVRGDIVDVFPVGAQKPYRLEFFGDTIEEIRLFDADTQRSRKNVEEITLLPMAPACLSLAEQEGCLQRLDGLRDAGVISENTHYSIKKALAEKNPALLPGVLFGDAAEMRDWLPSDTVWFVPEEAETAKNLEKLRQEVPIVLENESQSLLQPASCVLSAQPEAPWLGRDRVLFTDQLLGERNAGVDLIERPLSSFEALFPDPSAKDRPWQALVEGLRTWQKSYRQILLSFTTVRGRKKFLQLAEQDGIVPNLRYIQGEPGIMALIAPFRRGVYMEWEKTLILGEDILFPRANKVQQRYRKTFQGLHSFESLAEGDLLVHRQYGIGRFGGLHHLVVNNVGNDFLLIEYAGHDKLYVPADNLSQIQRFKGADGCQPALDRLGGNGWRNSRDKVRKAIEKIAADLVEMYAYRKVAKGFTYGPVTDLYREFEATFDYEETPDQARAIQDVLDDMMKPTPMDRLICGDVGFGKTEVALRAAFRAASEGRQVVLLCPTTVLAEQHYQTFRARLAGFPITVGLLSRFVSKFKQREVLEGCAKGSVDILIGTHRLLSDDVLMPHLGLLILDEEQRFGVRHKEKMKSIKKNIDVLTLTATPIPRTLQMSMSGLRDLSLIETPPENRKAVETLVINRDVAFLKTILTKELERGGQVFWVYNRVRGLEEVTRFLQTLVPNARVAMAHGQMGESGLEQVMYRFWHREIDILVATAIIESGLDFPNVNTIVIDQAQMFGLGQLYQLRGRVGRSERQAYCYLLVPNKDHMTKESLERMQIIQSLDYLGAGFQLAMEDLRLRGAGNILGEVQSGHMSRVGLDLYLEMLEDAVARIRGVPIANTVESEVNLGLPAHIPVTYIDDNRERMRFYKNLTSADDARAREEIVLEIRDRFGPLPVELRNFVAVLNFKPLLRTLQIARADIYVDRVTLVWLEGQTAVAPDAVLAWMGHIAGAKVLSSQALLVPLDAEQPFEQALNALAQDLASLAPVAESLVGE